MGRGGSDGCQGFSGVEVELLDVEFEVWGVKCEGVRCLRRETVNHER